MFHEIHCHILNRICRPGVDNDMIEIITGAVVKQYTHLPFLSNGCHGIKENGYHCMVEVGSRIERLKVYWRPPTALPSLTRQHLLLNNDVDLRLAAHVS